MKASAYMFIYTFIFFTVSERDHIAFLSFQSPNLKNRSMRKMSCINRHSHVSIKILFPCFKQPDMWRIVYSWPSVNVWNSVDEAPWRGTHIVLCGAHIRETTLSLRLRPQMIIFFKHFFQNSILSPKCKNTWK